MSVCITPKNSEDEALVFYNNELKVNLKTDSDVKQIKEIHKLEIFGRNY